MRTSCLAKKGSGVEWHFQQFTVFHTFHATLILSVIGAA
jgi:hypothetical protein